MYTIQKITNQHLNLIKDLAYKIWPVCYANILTDDQITYMLDNFYSIENLENCIQQNHQFVILYQDQQPLGFASYQINVNSAQQAKLHKLYVDTTQHKKGLGKKLIQFVENQAQLQAQNAVFLNVNIHNNAVNFYKKQGYSILKSEVIPIGNNYVMDDYVMIKTI